MKVQKELTIDGKIVNHIGSVKQFLFYQVEEDNQDASAEIFLVTKDTVIGKISLEADCGQNQGYISSIDIEEI